jgi:hypothetical protein
MRYVVYIEANEYPASLEPGKLYQVIPDPQAASHNQIRIIDESGEDYLYPAHYFSVHPVS